MDKLKPCPFCGSEVVYATYIEERKYGSKKPLIFCDSCKAEFSIEDDSPFINIDEDFKYRKRKTEESWNRRVNNWVFGEWIPVSERLPRESGNYPVWTAKGFGDHLSTSYWDGKDWSLRVVAWMPLTEPYKG